MTESFLALRQEKHCRVPLEYELQITANLEHENAEVPCFTRVIQNLRYWDSINPLNYQE